MSQRLPPLKSIEAFVAVAESLSYGKAASELNITKSAISRRIQSLEGDLGVRLLHRMNKALALTKDGQAYFEVTGPAFGALRSAGRVVRRPARNTTLRVSLPESFASYWLIPRLPLFYEIHQDIELSLDSLGYFKNLEGDNVDVAIRVSRAPLNAFHCERMMDIVQIPVASPALLRRVPLETVDDLAGHTLLHLKTMPDVWPEWLASVGREDLAGQKSLSFDTMSLSLDAAANGLGVAIGVENLCRRDFEAGRLVAPLPHRLEGRRALYFTCHKQDAAKPAIRKFRNWLLAEAGR